MQSGWLKYVKIPYISRRCSLNTFCQNYFPHRPCLCYIDIKLLHYRSKKTSKLCVTGLCEGNPPVPVTWKMIPFDDIIMEMSLWIKRILPFQFFDMFSWLNIFMLWMGAYHMEMDMIQWMWYGFAYIFLNIYLNLIHLEYVLIKSHHFSQITTKIGLNCKILTYDPLSQRQVSSEGP